MPFVLALVVLVVALLLFAFARDRRLRRRHGPLAGADIEAGYRRARGQADALGGGWDSGGGSGPP